MKKKNPFVNSGIMFLSSSYALITISQKADEEEKSRLLVK